MAQDRLNSRIIEQLGAKLAPKIGCEVDAGYESKAGAAAGDASA